MPEFVKIINEDNKPFDFHQNNAKRIIEPGGDVIVPWGIACTLFGNPNVPDIPPANERTLQYKKIRARYNYGDGLHSPEHWEARRPKVRVFDLEGDREIIMLIDDPKGEHLGEFNPNAQSVNKQTDVDALQRQIEMLTKQVTRLVQRDQAGPTANAPGTSNSPTAVEDSPGQGEDGIDSVFNIPTASDDDTATVDNPQAVPTGEIPAADDDAPPAAARKAVAKKVAAKPR